MSGLAFSKGQVCFMGSVLVWLLVTAAGAVPQPPLDRSPEEILRAAVGGEAQAQYELALDLMFRDQPPPARSTW